MTEQEVKSISGDLKGWGVGLLIMGMLHFSIKYLASEWGIVLIALGIAALVINHRGMFIALGCALVLIGVMNFIGGIQAGPGFWLFFGCMQVYWGFKEMAKFGRYAPAPAESDHSEETVTVEGR